MKGCFLSQIFRCLVLLAVLFLPPWNAVVAGTARAAAADPVSAPVRPEKELVIYAAIDAGAGEALTRDFTNLYPGVRVYLVTMTGAEVFNSHMQDLGRRQRVADLLWSSEVELQAALVKDGYAARYRPGVSGAVFPWANLSDMAFATAHEPVAMVYNRTLLGEKDLPASHRELLKFVGEERFRGKIATVDPEKNRRAFLFLTNDQSGGFMFWSLVQGFGRAGVRFFPDYGPLLDAVASGEALFGYNVPAREALRRAKADPAVGVLYFGDYTLSTPQTILVTRDAPHPVAARLWIEYILSPRGQEILTRESNLFPVRADVTGGEIAREPQKLPGGSGLKVMMPAGEVTRFIEKGIRRGFLVRWQEMLNQVK